MIWAALVLVKWRATGIKLVSAFCVRGSRGKEREAGEERGPAACDGAERVERGQCLQE